MPEQRYTIGEAVSLLDVDRVTLQDWLGKEKMRAMPDPRDKRSKLLTRDQILELARVHGKVIRDETSIGPHLTGVQRELVERVRHLEEVASGIVARLERIERTTQERYNRLQAQSDNRENVPIPQTASEYTGYVAPPESHYRAPGAYHGERLRPGEWRQLPPIPDGWLTPRKMAEALGVPPRSFFHALRPRFEGDGERVGHLEYHEGRWQAPHPGTFATELLDEAQQEAARAWFATRPRGQ